MMRTAAEGIGPHLGAHRSGFFEMADPDTDAVRRNLDRCTLPPLAGLWPAQNIGTQYLRQVRAGATLGIADTASEPLTADPVFADIGARSIIGVPIIRNRHWVAGSTSTTLTSAAGRRTDVALAHEAGEQTWDAVERARAEAALRRSEEQLRLATGGGGNRPVGRRRADRHIVLAGAGQSHVRHLA